VLFRRTKMGLFLSSEEVGQLEEYINQKLRLQPITAEE